MMEYGAQCVTVAGMIGMQLLYACNWDFKEQVCVRMYYSVIPGWKINIVIIMMHIVKMQQQFQTRSSVMEQDPII